MNKKLSVLLKGLNVKVYGSEDNIVRGVIDDSRKVKKGFLFVAIKGMTRDAHDFIPEVIVKGASVVVGEIEPQKKWLEKVTYVKVNSSRQAVSVIAANWFNNPARKLKIIGVTGTKGKTTTSSVLYHLLKTGRKKVGLISTIGAKIGKKEYDTGFHTSNPEPLALQKLISEMVKDGATHLVLEVTSHGLDQERVYGIEFDIAVLTNITHEHLDYHKTFTRYRDAKAKLFKSSKYWFINKDDDSSNYFKKLSKGKHFITTYSIKDKADFAADDISISDKTQFSVLAEKKTKTFSTSLLGAYNVANLTAAIAVARFLAIPWKEIQNALSSFEPPKGRLEKVKNKLGIEIFIDFAHTPDSLENVLTLLTQRKRGKLISVFGCAGERDTKKRSMMGKISAKLSDISIFTAEDPRTESVHDIIGEMVRGAKDTKAIEVDPEEFVEVIDGHVFMRVPERREAIILAVKYLAQKGDTVVILGKGHEQSMAYQDIEHDWSEHKAIETALSLDPSKAAVVLAAGKGTRMKSSTPKVINTLAGRPMISYTFENLRNAGFGVLICVVGYKKELVKNEVMGSVIFANQPLALGTGHAAECGIKLLDSPEFANALVMNGDDSAFYYPETIKAIYRDHIKQKAVVTFVSLTVNDPTGLGRIIRDKTGKLVGITEEKDATKEQKKITEVNDGLYVLDVSWAKRHFPKIKKSQSGEYYIVDLVKLAIKENKNVCVYKLNKSEEWLGVNTQNDLITADKQKRKVSS